MKFQKKTIHYLAKAILLIAVGLLLNIVPAKIVTHFELPVFFDCLGTILTAMMCGNMAAVIVGFISNAINGLSDAVTLYYGVINVLIAGCAYLFYQKKFFLSIPKILVVIFTFALIGGGLGSILTYFLYGYSIGEGISAPFAIALRDTCGLPDFWSQLLADIIIDVFDKGIVVISAVLLYRWIPRKIRLACNDTFHIDPNVDELAATTGRSLLRRVVAMVIVAELLLGSLACAIGYFLYQKVSIDKFTDIANGVTQAASVFIDGNRIDEFLTSGREADGYADTEEKLKKLKKSFPQTKYLYVYKIEKDGCHAVFDTPQESGEETSEPGEILPFDPSFEPYLPALLKGDTIEPIISDDTYGWLLTIYKPIKDSLHKTSAYVAADISMQEILEDDASFFIKFFSLFFSLSLIIMSIIVELVKSGIVRPINRMAYASSQFAYNLGTDKDKGLEILSTLDIHSQDEIKHLHTALLKMGNESLDYIKQLQEQTERITRMQDEIIENFAEMVEARDTSTGNHIKKTAHYVDAIARELQAEGEFKDILTDEYIEKLKRSAPLHDIGKIAVSDLILNKPGKLTDDEFTIMKSHTTEGKNILVKIEENAGDTMDENYLKESIEMALFHHEKWDGSGYPNRISGEDIPLSARIMAVADVFDALVAERIYKKPFTYEKAMEIITEGAGKHFDPVVVKAFCQISRRLYDERTKLDQEGQVL